MIAMDDTTKFLTAITVLTGIITLATWWWERRRTDPRRGRR